MQWFRSARSLLKQTFKEWNDDDVPRLGAALAFYAVFSIAPMLVLTLELAGWLFGEKAVSGELERTMRDLLGPAAAGAVQSIVREAGEGNDFTLIGAFMLIFGASAVLAQFRETMNIIWNVTPRREGFMKFIVNRSIAVVLVPCFVLLLIFMGGATTAISVMGSSLDVFGGALVWRLVDLLTSFVVLTFAFSLILKYTPSVNLTWKDVLAGGSLTSFLFVAGKSVLSYYLARGSTASAYGAAGSLVILLIWIFYSAQIVFFGSEFTQVYARSRGSHAPGTNQEPVAEDE
ncbi:MAG TPA: YihY/virulence factor BrkB family protein [Thermoanaerobaculia bacterium]|nr:YihY/virulence factor BrkB family protein [Thermoanaerobaculia bacterium]